MSGRWQKMAQNVYHHQPTRPQLAWSGNQVPATSTPWPPDPSWVGQVTRLPPPTRPVHQAPAGLARWVGSHHQATRPQLAWLGPRAPTTTPPGFLPCYGLPPPTRPCPLGLVVDSWSERKRGQPSGRCQNYDRGHQTQTTEYIWELCQDAGRKWHRMFRAL